MIASSQRRRKRAAEGGFTMVEMLVALVLVTIVLSGTLAMQVAVLQATGSSRSTAGTMTLMQDAVEEFQSARYDNLTTWYRTDCFDAQLQPLSDCSATATPPYTYRRTHQCYLSSGYYRLYVRIYERTIDGEDTYYWFAERKP